MKLYARYLRKSRAEEGEDLQAVLAKHRQALDALARAQHLAVVDTYEEVVSGESLATRPEMLRLLEAVEDGRYAGVLCMDIDRLGRGNMRDQGLILDAFRASKTLIITPDKTYDLTDDTDETLTEFKAFFARQEYKIIRKRMHRGVVATLEAGGYTSNPPFGYRPCRIGRYPSLEIIPEEARFVRLAFERYASGTGATAIADELNALGAKTRRGAPWTKNTVRYLLTNPVYTGMIYFNRHSCRKGGRTQGSYLKDATEWIVADGLHEAIISEDLWRAASDRRRLRYQPSRYDGKAHYALTSLCRCGSCGKHMQIVGAPRELRLHCMTRGCIASARYDLVEEAVWDSLREQLEALQLEQASGTDSRIAGAQSACDRIAASLARVESRITRLYDFLEDGTYDRATFLSRMETAERERSKLLDRQRIAAHNLAVLTDSNRAEQIARLQNALTLYPTTSEPARNELLKTIVESIDYQKEKKSKPNAFQITTHLRSFT